MKSIVFKAINRNSNNLLSLLFNNYHIDQRTKQRVSLYTLICISRKYISIDHFDFLKSNHYQLYAKLNNS